MLQVFLVGMLTALAVAFFELKLKNLLPLLQFSIIGLLFFAFVEEFGKFLGVYFAVSKSRFFDEPIDGMIYMITAAMGFATVENFLFLVGFAKALELTVLRFVGATLLHALASGFVGFYWVRRKLIKGFTLATLIHAGFNFLILRLPGYEIYATSILIIAAFFLFYDFDLIKNSFRK